MTRNHYIIIAVVFAAYMLMFVNQERSMSNYQPVKPPYPEGVRCT